MSLEITICDRKPLEVADCDLKACFIGTSLPLNADSDPEWDYLLQNAKLPACKLAMSRLVYMHIRPQAVRPLEHPERWPSPGGFLVSGASAPEHRP